MNYKKEPRFVTPCNITQVNRAMRLVADATEKAQIQRGCRKFNMDFSREIVRNGIMIGDMCRWAADTRGSECRKTYYRNLDRVKIRIQLCRGITNFSHCQRNLG